MEKTMTIPQISVFLENKAGQLADITRILSENQVNMRALNIAETGLRCSAADRG